MKLYSLTCVHTNNERGAEGCLNETHLYKAYEEALAALKAETEKDWVSAWDREIKERPIRGDFRQGEGREMATWEYECYIDGLDGLSKWYIHEFELGEDGR